MPFAYNVFLSVCFLYTLDDNAFAISNVASSLQEDYKTYCCVARASGDNLFMSIQKKFHQEEKKNSFEYLTTTDSESWDINIGYPFTISE